MRPDETELESVDLMHYIDIAWKRRWQIIIPTVIVAVLAGIVSLLLPKVWEVDAIIIPSKFLAQNEAGEFREVLVASPIQIAGQISQRSYDAVISAEQNIPIRKFPRISAENLRNTNLIRISIRERDPQSGQKILQSLFNHLKSDFDKKIDVEISSLSNQVERTKNKILDLENEIKTKENEIIKKQNDIILKELDAKAKELDAASRLIEKEKIKKDIESDQNRMKIIEQRILSIQEEMKSVKSRIDELDRLQQKSVTEKREEADTLALLLYSNEVQQNLRYFNSLDEKISAERLNIETILNSIKNKEQQLLQIDNQVLQINNQISQIKTSGETIRAEINSVQNDIRKVENSISDERNNIKLLEDKKNRIDYTQMIKEPASSKNPVFPNKRLFVIIAGLVTFCLLLGIVFLKDSLKNRKKMDPAKN